MSLYACTACALSLAAPRAQCPRCLRIATVVATGVRRAANDGAVGLRVVGGGQQHEGEDDDDGIEDDDPENAAPVILSQIEASGAERLRTNIRPLDRILGGGLVYGCVYVIVGGPGTGKSRFVLQLIRESDVDLAYYASVEELGEKIHYRAQEMGVAASRIRCWPKKATHLDAAFEIDFDPEIVVIDSLQAMPVRGVRDRNERLVEVMKAATTFAQETQSVVLVISRVNQAGVASGTRDVEHDGDGTIYLELAGIDEDDPRRRLRIAKHRYGNAPRRLYADMTAEGLQFEEGMRDSKSKDAPRAHAPSKSKTKSTRAKKKTPSRVKLASARKR